MKKKLLAIFCAMSLVATLAVTAVFTASAADIELIVRPQPSPSDAYGADTSGTPDADTTVGQTFFAPDKFNELAIEMMPLLWGNNGGSITGWRLTLYKWSGSAWVATYLVDAGAVFGSLGLPVGVQTAGAYYFEISNVTGTVSNGAGLPRNGDWRGLGTGYINRLSMAKDFAFGIAWKDNKEGSNSGSLALADSVPNSVTPVAEADEVSSAFDSETPRDNGNGGIFIQGWVADKWAVATPTTLNVYFGDGNIADLNPDTVIANKTHSGLGGVLSGWWGVTVTDEHGFNDNVGSGHSGATRVRIFAVRFDGRLQQLYDNTIIITTPEPIIVPGAYVSLVDDTSNTVDEKTAVVEVTVPEGYQLSASSPLDITGGLMAERTGWRNDGVSNKFSFTIPAGVTNNINVNANLVPDNAANFGCWGVSARPAAAGVTAGLRFGFRVYTGSGVSLPGQDGTWTATEWGVYRYNGEETDAGTVVGNPDKTMRCPVLYDSCSDYIDFTYVLTSSNFPTTYGDIVYSVVPYVIYTKDGGEGTLEVKGTTVAKTSYNALVGSYNVQGS
jgi:hypothetical protein